MKTDKQIVLASASPRRKQLLEEIGMDFIVHPSDFEEKDSHLTPEELAIHNALGKAQKVSKHYKNALIIGVDTVVAFEDHQINKPKDPEDAKRILRLLSNTTHRVISGLCVMDSEGRKVLTTTETTLITMDRLDEDIIEGYVNSGEGVDKAAGYAIQGKGSLFVSKIEGDYFNVVGLPIYKLRKMMHKFGVKKWF
ncbi:septum formation protein Maf [Candidatus Peregrinibacteria bacterium]|jgi:septum formation protein|nr:septum formation protein Maf [Candidatus Peregrinibacteria bacterium]MBT7736134.1 septum formation protein Maf [Candidatus Peregrinibacteria bacterium]